jgi:predicted extracellular nuclease
MVKKFLFLFILFINCIIGQNKNIFYVASWNVENLFDTLDDKTKDDNEFLPESDKNWNHEKYNLKINNLTKVISDMNDKQGPDLLGLIEVENINVVEDLLKNLNKANDKSYKIVHIESLDPRGIDNALIYNSDIFEVIKTTPLRIQLETENTETRYILKIELAIKKTEDSNSLIVYVNHWPSRRGGEDVSEKNRISAAKTLIEDIEKLAKLNPYILIFGDFNDEPENASIKSILGAKGFDDLTNKEINLLNLASEKKKNGEGTFYYKGNWNMLDQMIISKNLVDGKIIGYVPESFEIFKPEYMVTKEGFYKGSSIPTYGGKKYLGGYSDHFPIVAKFYFISK